MTKHLFLFVLLLVQTGESHELTIAGTRFLLDGKPFPYTGVSFFNAVYNPAFNKTSEDRVAWMRKFQRYGINVLRIWSQWDNKRGFVDSCAECSLYHQDGRLRNEHVGKLKAILTDADREGMVIELTLFSQESWHDGIKLAPDAAARGLTALTRELAAFRNVTFQVWNEFSELVPEHVKTIKSIDPKRLVSNSPGGGGAIIGEPAQQRVLDYLSPHTSRQGNGKTWLVAPTEIRYLVERYRKPVVDDEPARNGTSQFGGPKERTHPTDHILHIWEVWKAGGYTTYHHDMFQLGAGSPSVPPSGIPDPEFNPYHRTVFEFIAQRARYAPDHAR
ncbi:MAG: hypothetical protein HY820_25425 [Acidobacteria bacterium]|nr:hypothetical protein [Acidobacteriota bacterium]